MQQVLRRLAIAGVFFAWVLPRVLPLLLYPGVYSFDTWYFMGHVESILISNHIPPLSPFEFYYISHPALYLFAIQITYFFGLSLIDAFRVFAVILIIVNGIDYFIEKIENIIDVEKLRSNRF